MRIAAALLLAVLLTACGAPAAASPSMAVPPAATPSPVAIASPAVEPPPTPTAAPSPTPVDEPVTVRLPVTACATSTGTDDPPPSPPATADAIVTASLAGRIGVYGDGYDLVMGPIGWSCEAQIGADGSTSIRVWSPGDARAQVIAETNGGCYGCALILTCPTFAAHRSNTLSTSACAIPSARRRSRSGRDGRADRLHRSARDRRYRHRLGRALRGARPRLVQQRWRLGLRVQVDLRACPGRRGPVRTDPRLRPDPPARPASGVAARRDRSDRPACPVVWPRAPPSASARQRPAARVAGV